MLQKIASYFTPVGLNAVNYKDRGDINFIDVGSINGLSEPWNRHARKIKNLLNFDPFETSHTNKSVITSSTALWESDAELPFYIYKGLDGTGSSLYRQNIEYVRQNFESLRRLGPPELAETWFERSSLVEVRRLSCTTLDNVIARTLPNTSFHFLKIDAQGAEFNILKGGHQLLATSCVGLHLELFTIPLYEGIALLPEVECFLRRYSFELYRKNPPHGTFDSQHDCIFLKTNGDPALIAKIKDIYAE